MLKRVLIIIVVLCSAFASAEPRTKSAAKAKAESVVAHVISPIPNPAPTTPLSPTPPLKLSYEASSPADQKPYWSSKPDLQKRMREDRFITVSAKKEESGRKEIYTLAGAGVVNRGKDACFTLSQQYSQLKDVSDHFKTVTFDEKQQKLFVVVDALGYQARMLMHITPVTTPVRSELQWEVVWGSFKGMKGVIGFESLSSRQTEISFQGKFEAPELPLPKFIMGFAFEVVTQKVAEKMRSYLEEHLP